MHLERLDIDGFRNCCESVRFDPVLTLLLGENNAGKSNIIDALRLVLMAEPGSQRLRPQLSDFTRGPDGRRTVEEFSITAVLADLNVIEQGRLSLALSPSEGYAKARIGLRARIGPDEQVTWYRCGGDFDRSDLEHRALNSVHHTYLPPRRDAGGELQPGRTNRLARFLYALTPEQADRDRLVRVAESANRDLASDPRIRHAVGLVRGVLSEMTLQDHAPESDIAFADAEFVGLARQLVARLGERGARELGESGLGYQNLLNMAVLLAHLGEADPMHAPLGVLLIEEPEAHLHPHLQGLLLRYLQAPSEGGTKRQAIVTSNSPQFAAAAELDQLVVVAKPADAARAVAHPAAAAEMSEEDRAHVRRFLDATKAALFFARGVILVEGVCEQLLLPQLARIIGRDLAEAGVVVINTGGVPVHPLARLFADDGLPISCAIVSDGDADPAAPDVDNLRLQPMHRTERLRALRGNFVDVFVADVALEWDLAYAQPREPLLLEGMGALDPRCASRLAAKTGLSASAWAAEFTDELADKAAFAQELAGKLEADPEARLVVPAYLKGAIEHATSPPRPAGQRRGQARNGKAPWGDT